MFRRHGGLNPIVSEAIPGFVGCFLVWLRRRFVLFRCFFCWRNANLAGRFASRRCCRVSFCCVCCFFHGLPRLWSQRVSYFLHTFLPLLSLSGPSLRARSAATEEKKTGVGAGVSHPCVTAYLFKSQLACLIAQDQMLLFVLSSSKSFSWTLYIHDPVKLLTLCSCCASVSSWSGSITSSSLNSSTLSNRSDACFFSSGTAVYALDIVLWDFTLICGPAGNRTTTGNLSAPSRTTRYWLSRDDDEQFRWVLERQALRQT